MEVLEALEIWKKATYTLTQYEKVNEDFTTELVVCPRRVTKIFCRTISDAYQNEIRSIFDKRKHLKKRITDCNRKIEKAKALPLDNAICI